MMKRTFGSGIARWLAMSDDVWRRHANPWSVWTRCKVLPIIILAFWSRTVFGWWSLVLILTAFLWAWFNPRLFPVPRSTDNWASKAVFGERIWLNRNNIPVPKHHRLMPNILSVVSGIGLPYIIWGIWRLEFWPCLGGCLFVYAGKLWFLDRMVWLFEEMKDASPEYSSWLYTSHL